MRYLVTGAAGFIGFHVSRQLLERGHDVLGIDSLNDYYDVRLKQDRLGQLALSRNFHFSRVDLAHRAASETLFLNSEFDVVIHLAAQPGVRYSLENPHAYIDSNIVGFLNVLEGCRYAAPGQLIYASSSSVYGGNTKVPFATADEVNQPVSLYAATKRSNELMAETYSHLFDIPMTGLRFFTVYGPWGRPDMAIYKFTKAILENRPIEVYNHGQMRRDFTYIDDIVDGILRIADSTGQSGSEATVRKHRIYNIGHNQPVELKKLIEVLETALNKRAIKRFLPMQPGDLVETYADIDDICRDHGFMPRTGIEAGINQFVAWYLEYHRVATNSMRLAA